MFFSFASINYDLIRDVFFSAGKLQDKLGVKKSRGQRYIDIFMSLFGHNPTILYFKIDSRKLKNKFFYCSENARNRKCAKDIEKNP